MTTRRSPFLPTTLEAGLLAIYPTLLIIGSLFALLDPTARSAPYNNNTQSHHPSTAPSYFAKKSNVFNIFFVKRGWAWITLSYFYFLFTHPSTAASAKRVQGALRWCIVTTWWIFVTQWFFGPAIIDRGFLLTGGVCALEEQAVVGGVELGEKKMFVTHMACKAVGGKWQNGHDISGHVFLLVLGSMFLFEEMLHVVLRSTKTREERTIVMVDGAVKSAHVEGNGSVDAPGQWTLGSKVVLGVSGLSLYMLLMTAAYFHTWFEKVLQISHHR